jgi:hypothetical protein
MSFEKIKKSNNYFFMSAIPSTPLAPFFSSLSFLLTLFPRVSRKKTAMGRVSEKLHCWQLRMFVRMRLFTVSMGTGCIELNLFSLGNLFVQHLHFSH